MAIGKGFFKVRVQPWVIGLFLMAMVASCASLPKSERDYPIGYRENGWASWYGEPFHGRATASGEIYDMYGMTAAHRLMPLGTTVKVTHRKNGRAVTVRINDRGPFVRGRDLDLSYGAADHLRMIAAGSAPVTIAVVSLPPASKGPAGGLFTVQVGAFENKENARQLTKHLSQRYSDVYWVTVPIHRKTIYRVRVGAFRQEHQAVRLAERLSAEDKLETFVIRKDP